MKPKTILQKRVYEIHKNLPALTQHQKEWALEHCFKHLCIFHKTTKEYICVDCGHRWKYDDLSGNCPHCKAVLTFHDKPRQRVFKDWNYYSIIQTYQEFTVIRIFYIDRYIKLGEVHNLGDFYEISQYWFSNNGGQVILAKNKLMFSFYSNTPFNLRSELNVKQACKEYDYISPYQVYPKIQVSKALKRNGLKKSFRGFREVDVIRYLLSEPIYETLWKQKDLPMIKRFHSDGYRIKKYWKQILKFKKRDYKVENIGLWFDYLDLLSYFGKDINNPHYIFPADFTAAHDLYMQRKRKRMEKENEERRREYEKEAKERELQRIIEQEKKAEEFIKNKSKYFDITFRNSNIIVVVLSSIDAYKKEGDTLHHCVFTNTYYDRKNSLILSARLIDTPDTPLETIELSLTDGHILQCYGSHNQETQYHNEIISLVNQHSHLILAA